MSGIQLENIFKTLFWLAGILAAVLQFAGYFFHKRILFQLQRGDFSDADRKLFQSEFIARLRDEDLMAFLFTIACAYFGWVVLYKPYGFLPVLAVVLLTACLCGYGSWQRLQSGKGKALFLTEEQLLILNRGQLLFCWGVPLLMAAEISLISVLVFSPEQLDQLVWLRQFTK